MSKYKVIVKLKSHTDGNRGFASYHTDNLLSLTEFLDRKWSGWRYFNVFEGSKGQSAGKQLANFTCKNRPTTKILQ